MIEHKTQEPVAVKDKLLQAQAIWEKYQKTIFYALTAIVLVVGGYFAYVEYIQKPNEEKAADLIYKAQQYFAIDSSNLVLNGDGSNKGVLYIISKYGNTKSGNLAHYYAGISYLKLGNFNKAVEYLSDFSTNARQIQMVAYGALADAYSELRKNDDAVNYYTKAGKTFEKDEASSSEYLFRAALLSESIGKTKEALELYKEIKAKYPKTDKGAQADKYIYRLSIEKNDLSVN
jgi:tetratricopeptide (TPR) repeat protein